MLKRPGAKLRILIYGVDSTPDPYSGVGIARSLRLAFPSCELVALDCSPQSSGLNWPDFDEWMVVSDRSHLARLCGELAHNQYLLPCDDDEIYRFAADLRDNKQVLSPTAECVRQLRKPARALARLLGVGVPRSLLLPVTRRSLETFLERCGPRVWRKGRIAGAEQVKVRSVLSQTDFVTDKVRRSRDELLQAHVEGSLEVLAFAAYRGEFLNGVWMRKQGVTSKGKTWSGVVTVLSEEWQSRLELISRRLSWNGGGALEFIRDGEDRLWLIDANPRFPAWIHGATLCGVNLPGELISAVSGRRARKAGREGKAFSRVVVEVAVRPQLAGHLRSDVVD
jgi:diaminopimelate decarboxylase